MTADGHTKGSIKRTALHHAMHGTVHREYERDTLVLYEPNNLLNRTTSIEMSMHVFFVSSREVTFSLPIIPIGTVPATPVAFTSRLSQLSLRHVPNATSVAFSLPTAMVKTLPPRSTAASSGASAGTRKPPMHLPHCPHPDSILQPHENPWSVLGLETPSYAEALTLKPELIKEAHRKMTLVWHPDKCQLHNATTMMATVNASREILLNTTMVKAWARSCCYTVEPQPIEGPSRILLGNAQLQQLLLRGYLQDLRQKPNKHGVSKAPAAEKALAVVRCKSLILYGGLVIPTKVNQTTEQSYLQAKDELISAVTRLHVANKKELMKRNVRRRQREIGEQLGSGTSWSIKQITKAATKWQRAAFKRISITHRAAHERRKRHSSHEFEEREIEVEWKVFRQRIRSSVGFSDMPKQKDKVQPGTAKYRYSRSDKQKTDAKDRFRIKRKVKREPLKRRLALPPVPLFDDKPAAEVTKPKGPPQAPAAKSEKKQSRNERRRKAAAVAAQSLPLFDSGPSPKRAKTSASSSNQETADAGSRVPVSGIETRPVASPVVIGAKAPIPRKHWSSNPKNRPKPSAKIAQYIARASAPFVPGPAYVVPHRRASSASNAHLLPIADAEPDTGIAPPTSVPVKYTEDQRNMFDWMCRQSNTFMDHSLHYHVSNYFNSRESDCRRCAIHGEPNHLGVYRPECEQHLCDNCFESRRLLDPATQRKYDESHPATFGGPTRYDQTLRELPDRFPRSLAECDPGWVAHTWFQTTHASILPMSRQTEQDKPKCELPRLWLATMKKLPAKLH